MQLLTLLKIWLLSCTLALSLVACGGDDGDESSDASEPTEVSDGSESSDAADSLSPIGLCH